MRYPSILSDEEAVKAWLRDYSEELLAVGIYTPPDPIAAGRPAGSPPFHPEWPGGDGGDQNQSALEFTFPLANAGSDENSMA